MGGEPEDRFLRGGDGDLIQFGSARTPRRALARWARRPVVRWLAGVAAIVTVAAVVVTAALPGTGGVSRPQSRGSAHHSAGPARPVGPAGSGPVAVEKLGHPLISGSSNGDLLALAGGWEPGADGGALIRIQFTKGTITSTRIPALDSNGPVSVLAVGGEAIIRPLDVVPGYAVPDGRGARGLPAALDNGGQLFPGPRAGQLWISSYGPDGSVLRLVTTAGAAAGQEIRLPASESNGGVPDGRGYVLVQVGDAVDDARPDGLHQVAVGTLAATGSAAWLVSNCPGAARCVNTVVDPATGTRRVLPGDANLFGGPSQSGPGQVSPDGRFAALLRYGPGRHATVGLLDLRTGAQRDFPVGDASPNGILVWSSDSRWLFTLTADGTIEAADVRTGQVRGLGVALPPVSYLAAGQP